MLNLYDRSVQDIFYDKIKREIKEARSEKVNINEDLFSSTSIKSGLGGILLN